MEATKQRCEMNIEECLVCSSRVGKAMIGKGRIRVEVGELVMQKLEKEEFCDGGMT